MKVCVRVCHDVTVGAPIANPTDFETYLCVRVRMRVRVQARARVCARMCV